MNFKPKNRDWVKNAAIVFLAVLLVLTFFSNTWMNRSLPEVATQYVTDGAITAKVRGTGTVAANGTHQVKAEGTREIRAVMVKSGQEVQAGDVLFVLGQGASAEIEAAQDTLRSLQTSYARAALGITSPDYSLDEWRLQQSDAALKEAKAALDKAKAALDKIIAGSTESGLLEQKAKAEQAVKDAETAKTEAEKKLQTEQETLAIYKNAYDSVVLEQQQKLAEAESALLDAIANVNVDPAYKQAVADAQTALTAAQNQLTEAQAALDAAKAEQAALPEDATEEQKQAAQAKVDAAQAAVDSAQANLDAAQAALDEAIAQAEQTDPAVTAAREARDNAKAALEAAIDKSNKTDLTNAETRVEEAEKAVTEAQEKVQDAQKKLEEVEAKIDEIQRTGPNALAYQAAKAAYTAAQEAYLSQKQSLNEKKRSDERSQQSTYIDLSDLGSQITLARKKLDELSGGEENQILAKVAGTVATVDCTSGDLKNKGDLLCTIEVPDMGYTLSFSVTNEQARRLRPGDTGTVSNFYWGREVQATLKTITVDPKNPQNNKLLTFDLEGDVNTGAELTVSVGQKSANYDVIVPNSAIRSDSNGSFVLKIEAKNSPLGNRYIARRVPVEVLAADDTNSAVTGNLGWGDYVVTTSNAPVKAGDLVRLAD